jgi:hypothetical protein
LNRRKEIRDDSASPPPPALALELKELPVLAYWAEIEAEAGLLVPHKSASSNVSLSLDIRIASR